MTAIDAQSDLASGAEAHVHATITLAQYQVQVTIAVDVTGRDGIEDIVVHAAAPVPRLGGQASRRTLLEVADRRIVDVENDQVPQPIAINVGDQQIVRFGGRRKRDSLELPCEALVENKDPPHSSWCDYA